MALACHSPGQHLGHSSRWAPPRATPARRSLGNKHGFMVLTTVNDAVDCGSHSRAFQGSGTHLLVCVALAQRGRTLGPQDGVEPGPDQWDQYDECEVPSLCCEPLDCIFVPFRNIAAHLSRCLRACGRRIRTPRRVHSSTTETP
jgi:hypothetical protein